MVRRELSEADVGFNAWDLRCGHKCYIHVEVHVLTCS